MVAKHGQHLAKKTLTFAKNGIVCWICGVRLEQCIGTQELQKAQYN